MSWLPKPDPRRPRTTLGHLAGLISPDLTSAGAVFLGRNGAQRRARAVAALRRSRTNRRMRALVAGPGGRLAWRSVPAPPDPTGTAAVVRPVAVATCDLDRPLAHGQTPFPLPLRIGHECVAEVLAVGAEVTTLAVGDLVVVPFQISCGACPPCRHGHTANCASVPPLSMYGFGVAGGHWGGAVADELAVPYADGMLVPLPRGVEPATAASVSDTVCDAYRHLAPHLAALRAAGRELAVTVLAAQDDRHPFSPSVPLYAGLAARALGFGAATLVDHRLEVREHAHRLGLDAVPPADLAGLQATPLVVDLTGEARGLARALRVTAEDGICSSAGGLAAYNRLPTGLMFARNQTLHVGRTHARALIPAVLELVAAGSLRPQDVISARGRLDDAPEALRAHYSSDETKTVLTA